MRVRRAAAGGLTAGLLVSAGWLAVGPSGPDAAVAASPTPSTTPTPRCSLSVPPVCGGTSTSPSPRPSHHRPSHSPRPRHSPSPTQALTPTAIATHHHVSTAATTSASAVATTSTPSPQPTLSTATQTFTPVQQGVVPRHPAKPHTKPVADKSSATGSRSITEYFVWVVLLAVLIGAIGAAVLYATRDARGRR